MTKKIVILFCFISCICYAQESGTTKYEPGRNIFEFAAKAGASGFLYDSQVGQMSPGYNTGVAFNYIFRSRKHIGVRLGLEAESSQSRFVAKDYSDSFEYLNDNYSYIIKDLHEKHTQVYLSVPLQLGLYADWVNLFIGPKVAFPLASWTRQQITNATMTAEDITTGEIITDMPAITAGTIEKQFLAENEGIRTSPTYLPKVWVMLAADLSFDVKIDNHHCLGLGFYADYALNHALISRTDNVSLLYLVPSQQENTLARDSESIMKANYKGNPLINNFGYFSAGFKVSFKVWD